MPNKVLLFLCLLFSQVVTAQRTRVDQAPLRYRVNKQWDSVQVDAIRKHKSIPFGRRMDTAQIHAMQKHKPVPFGSEVYPLRGKLILGVKLDPELVNYKSAGIRSGSRHFDGFLISDSTAATVVMAINDDDNVKNYRYHVVTDDSVELVPWSVPTPPRDDPESGWAYAPIGNFKVLGKEIVVEVVNIKDYSARAGIVLDWRVTHKPVVTQLNARAYNDGFTITKGHSRGYAKKFDETTGLPLDLTMRVNSITEFSFTFKDHETLPYYASVYRDSSGVKKFLISRKQIKGTNYTLSTADYNVPGKYVLTIKPFLQDTTQTLTFPFEVILRAPEKEPINKKLLLWILGIALLFGALYLYNRQRLRKANREKIIANLKLSAVRAQLNPHFMFNALTSIQNLMNQNDNKGANHYLGKFARLTRQVLNASGQELVSLEDELTMIANYLEMEQLRFGFNYTLFVDDTINKPNTEIPTMLLQPFIENAAKHGVSALQSKGKIDITIAKQGANSLVLTVADNGPGFGENLSNNSGYGLKLSEERIELLNKIYPGQHIAMQINSNSRGAKITITLTDWL